jgi:MFS family permease
MFTSLKKPALVQIYLLHLFALLASSMTQSIFILYALELQADILTITLTTTIASTLTILLEVPFGMLSDRFGRKPMLIYTRVIVVVGTVARVVATEPSHLLVASFLGGLSGGEFLPTLLTMISDVAEPEERKEALSTVFIFSGIGLLISPILSSALLLVPQISLRNVYQIALAGEIALLAYIIIGVQETKPKTAEAAAPNHRLFLSKLIRQRSYLGLLLMTGMVSFARASVTTYLQIYAKTVLTLSNAEVSSFTVFTNVSSLSIRFFSTTLLAKLGLKPLLISFLIINGVTDFIALTAKDYPVLTLVFFLLGLSYGAMRILQSIWVAEESSRDNRGVANSLHMASVSSGNILQLATAPLFEAAGFTPIFALSGILCLTATLSPLLLYTADTENSA